MIFIQDIAKTFKTPAGIFYALRSVDLDIRDGDFVALVGKSGTVKSTLLNIGV